MIDTGRAAVFSRILQNRDLSQGKMKILFQCQFLEPIPCIRQVLLQVIYVGTLEQLPNQTSILFQLSQKFGLDGLILTERVHIITQHLFSDFWLLRIVLTSIHYLNPDMDF